MSNASIYVCEEHGSGVVVTFTYQDDQDGTGGTECPLCVEQKEAIELQKQVDELNSQVEDLTSTVDSLNRKLERLEPE